jgi:hypothetical protein
MRQSDKNGGLGATQERIAGISPVSFSDRMKVGETQYLQLGDVVVRLLVKLVYGFGCRPRICSEQEANNVEEALERYVELLAEKSRN